MNYKHIFLSMALTLPLSSMSMDRKRCFESSEEEESFGDQNASEKRSRASATPNDIFIEQISWQMNQVNLGSDQDEDDYAQADANPLKRTERFEDQGLDDEITTKATKDDTRTQATYHSFDVQAMARNLDDGIWWAQLNTINNTLKNNSQIGQNEAQDLIWRYIARANELLGVLYSMEEKSRPKWMKLFGFSRLHIAASLGHLTVIEKLFEYNHVDTLDITGARLTARLLWRTEKNTLRNERQNVINYLMKFA